jgi:hypothetical protein
MASGRSDLALWSSVASTVRCSPATIGSQTSSSSERSDASASSISSLWNSSRTGPVHSLSAFECPELVSCLVYIPHHRIELDGIDVAHQ